MGEVNCKSVRTFLWDYMAGTLVESDRRAVATHVDECRECNLHRAEVRSLRTGLRNLPQRQISPLLATRVQVIASRERARQLARLDFAAWIHELRSRAKLFFDNLLRPLAVPAAGGILASFLCFGIIVDTLHIRPDWANDVPIGLFTQVAIDNFSPFSVNGKDVMVQLTVDATGKVSDFMVPNTDVTPDEMKEIGNLVLYSTFIPATAFGQRVSGKILVNIHHINIHG
jgi:hypothetical protein